MKRWLTIAQAAARHRSPRRVIVQAIYHGTLKSTGFGRNRRVLLDDVDAMTPYLPHDDEVTKATRFRFVLTFGQIRLISYSLTKAVGSDYLSDHDKETGRDLQLIFGNPDGWERA